MKRYASRVAMTAATIASITIGTIGSARAQEGPILGHETLGDGADTVIVLHDWLGNAGTWDPVKPYLDGEAFTFVFADVRGYGRSRDLTGAYTVGEVASDIRRLADHLGVDSFHLIGHSMTGMAAHRLAVDAARGDLEGLGKVITVAPVTAAGYPADEETRDFFRAIPHDRETTMAAFDALTGGRYLSAWAEHKADLNIASSTEAAMHGYRAMVLDGGFKDEAVAAEGGPPMLVIGGRHDLPGVQEAYLREVVPQMFPQAEITIIEGAGHYPMDETPVTLATLIDAFLKR